MAAMRVVVQPDVPACQCPVDAFYMKHIQRAKMSVSPQFFPGQHLHHHAHTAGRDTLAESRHPAAGLQVTGAAVPHVEEGPREQRAHARLTLPFVPTKAFLTLHNPFFA